MNTTAPLLVAGLLVCALFASAGFAAKPTPLFVAYAEIGYDTSYHVFDDAYPVTMNLADGKGTFGQTSVATAVEFVIDFDMAPKCPSADYVPFAVVDLDWAVVLTMPDLSQLFGHFNEGWLCMNPGTGHMIGEVRGDFDEGIGRFAGSGGSFVSPFQCYALNSSIGLRSLDGSISGIAELTSHRGYEGPQ